MVLLISSLLLVIGILITGIGIRTDEDSLQIIGFCTAILTILIGFFIVGCGVPSELKEIKINDYKYKKTYNYTVISLDLDEFHLGDDKNGIRSSRKLFVYNNIYKKNTYLKLKYGINSYGSMIDETLFICKNENGEFCVKFECESEDE